MLNLAPFLSGQFGNVDIHFKQGFEIHGPA